jgi:hypothetical protein
VDAGLVARRRDVGGESGRAAHHRPEQEERRTDSPACEQLQQRWGVAGVRAVVEGEGDMVVTALAGQPGEEPCPHRTQRGEAGPGMGHREAPCHHCPGGQRAVPACHRPLTMCTALAELPSVTLRSDTPGHSRRACVTEIMAKSC